MSEIHVVSEGDIVLQAFTDLETAKEWEKEYANISNYNCLGRWGSRKGRRMIKTMWEDTATGKEVSTFITTLDLMETK